MDAPALITKLCKKCGAERASRNCKSCASSWKAKHQERVKAHRAAWVEKNKDKNKSIRKKSEKAWRDRNPEKAANIRKRAYAKFKEAHPEKLSEYSRNWQKKNPEKVRVWRKRDAHKLSQRKAAYYAGKLGATPEWANKFFMEEAYDLARTRSRVTGFKWHVDHIVPLRGKLVCGLHVENNLQVIPGTENLTKSNRCWQDMP